MSRREIDPATLEGDGLLAWFRRSPDEVENDRRERAQARHDEYFGELAYLEPPLRAPQVRWTPNEARGVEARAPGAPPVRPWLRDPSVAPEGAAPGSFFDVYRPLPGGDEYVTNAPRPLSYVRPSVWGGGYYILNDGSVVTGAEVDRIFAEQNLRRTGAEHAPPLRKVKVVDRLPSGVVPKAGTLARDEREADNICHPDGGWEYDPQFAGMREHTRLYQAQISRAPGLEYVVRPADGAPVRFDGCAWWSKRHELLEAKGEGYEELFENASIYNFLKGPREKTVGQAERQIGVARGAPVEWDIAEPGALTYFGTFMKGLPEGMPHPELRFVPPVYRKRGR